MLPNSSVLQVTYEYSEHIKRVRRRSSLTQQALADRLGVSFATVNRWKNAQTKPSHFFWSQIDPLPHQRIAVEHSRRRIVGNNADCVGRVVLRPCGEER